VGSLSGAGFYEMKASVDFKNTSARSVSGDFSKPYLNIS